MTKPKWKMLQIKTTSNGRTLERFNIPLIESSFNLKLQLRRRNQNQIWFKLRLTLFEENLKILKVEYISNLWWDLPQIINLKSEDQNKNWLKFIPAQWKMASTKIWICQQLLIGTSLNLKLFDLEVYRGK